MIVDRRFRGAYCLGRQSFFTRQYIPEDNSEHHTSRRENLKSHTALLLLYFTLYNYQRISKNAVSKIHSSKTINRITPALNVDVSKAVSTFRVERITGYDYCFSWFLSLMPLWVQALKQKYY
jgi:hypothetical protein